MTYSANPGAILGVVSALALIGIGVAVGALRPRRSAAVALSAFAILWGASIAAANVAQMATDAASARFWLSLDLLLLIPVHLPILAFVSLYPRPTNALGRNPIALALATLPALALFLLFFAAPTLFIERLESTPDALVTVPGPLFEVVGIGNGVVAVAAALAVVARGLARESDAFGQSRLLIIVAAFVPYVAYRGASLGTDVATGALAADAMLNAQIAVGAVVSLGAVGYAFVVAFRGRLAWRWALVGAAAAAAAFAALEFVALASEIVGFSTPGLWRLVMVALLAYGLARYSLFDVEVRLASFVGPAAWLAASFVGLAILWVVFGATFSRVPTLALIVSVAWIATTYPVVRLTAGGLGRAAPHLREREYLYKRKLDVYRAAVEDARAHGAGEATEQRFLTQLRKSLGISEAEHRILLLVLEGQEKYARRPNASTDSQYRVERELGRGSYGRALLAHDVALDRRVVLKQPLANWVLDPRARADFLNEARLAARLEHPNVVRIHHVDAQEDPPVIVMEFVEGGSLEALLQREPRLSAERAVPLARDILRGLEAIHSLGIVHRDLKPANILLSRNGVAKIADFGVARAPPDAAATIGPSDQPGSVAFMSPEQARGEAVDARSDLYSVGVIVYRMLAGRHYIDLRGASESRARRLVGEAAPDLSAVPHELADWVDRLLAKEPDARFPSATHALAAMPAAPSATR